MDSLKGFDIVVRDIKKGEQATYDYRSFYDDDKEGFKCNCRKINCCKRVLYIHPIPLKLKRFWDKKIKSAIKKIKSVDQPLKQDLIKKNKKFA